MTLRILSQGGAINILAATCHVSRQLLRETVESMERLHRVTVVISDITLQQDSIDHTWRRLYRNLIFSFSNTPSSNSSIKKF